MRGRSPRSLVVWTLFALAVAASLAATVTAQNGSTNETDENATDDDGSGDGAGDGGGDTNTTNETNDTPPANEGNGRFGRPDDPSAVQRGEVPWIALGVGVVAFGAAIVLAREA